MSIRSENYLNTPVLFEGLEYLSGNVQLVPISDVDGILDAHGRGWMFFEIKYKDAPLPDGQRIWLERLVNDTGKQRPSIAVICRHQGGEKIYLKDCIVTEAYFRGEWHEATKIFTAKDIIDWFLRRNAPEMLITQKQAR